MWQHTGATSLPLEKYDSVRQATDYIIMRRVRFACYITKTTDMHSDYVILIVFPWQQLLHKLASLLRYTFISSLLPILLKSPSFT